MPEWNPEQYLKFRTERTQPAVDLISRIPLDSPADVLDVGCGPGNSTVELFKRFPNANILGIDSSERMIETAAAQYPQMRFAVCDAEHELPSIGRRFDVVFSNACIQWVPEHRKLSPALMDLLRPGGILAVQTPMNYEEPIHQIISRTVASQEWSSKLSSSRIFYNLTPAEYFDLLSEITEDFSLWSTTYYHMMPSHEAIMEWYRATGLRPYLDALKTETERNAFEQQIFLQVQKEYPRQQSGKIIFRFPRFFFLAKRSRF